MFIFLICVKMMFTQVFEYLELIECVKIRRVSSKFEIAFKQYLQISNRIVVSLVYRVCKADYLPFVKYLIHNLHDISYTILIVSVETERLNIMRHIMANTTLDSVKLNYLLHLAPIDSPEAAFIQRALRDK